MKVEQSPFVIPPVSVTPILSQRHSYSTESTLVSPFAPSFPRLARFVTWFWNWIRSFFIKKEAPKQPPTPSLEALRAIQLAQAEKEANSESLINAPTIGLGLAGIGLCYWQWERLYPLATGAAGKIMAIPSLLWSAVPSMLAIQTTTMINSRIERKIEPYMPQWIAKGASLAATSAAVWYTSNYLGYPMGQAYLGFLSRMTFESGIPSLVVPLACSQITNYASPEKVFWAITAFNVARFAQLSFSLPPVQTKAYS
ncbi:MAG: hypothetical protein JSS30_03745 [Verrucomicrobia bacterium]|nr:hypothetical protein [Verrucomicrobiota bacterium]